MLTTDTMKNAMEEYRKGASLMQQERYKEAIPYLIRAVDAFRTYDAEGHPAEHTLENGVSALANALFQLGICAEQTDDISRAVTCFETAYINERFEHFRSFRAFSRNLASHLVACYERQLDATSPHDVGALLTRNSAFDTSYRFPFSLDPQMIPYARLYELAPERYEHFRMFYDQAKRKDAQLRRSGSRTDDQTLRRISIGVWGVIAAIWIAYGIVVLRTLI